MSLEATFLYPLSLVLWIVDWYSVVTTMMEMSYSMEIFMQRMDFYNVGKLTAKITKLMIQIHMKDLFG